jgi:N-acetylmuramoyl-L-alanine amidase
MLLLATLLIAAPMPLIVIDAGHGGAQDGAIGVCGAKEKDVTLGISRHLVQLLEQSGQVHAIATREGDATLDLKQRAQFANDAKADMFVSVHANSNSMAKTQGVETFFLSRNASDRRVAKLVARENELAKGASAATDETTRLLETLALSASHVESARLAERVNTSLTRELAVKGRGVLQAPFFVLLGAHMPSTLIEVGFLTNKAECERLASDSHREHLAQIIASAILLHVSREELALAPRTH